MDYIEVTCMLAKDNKIPDASEIVVALLAELGFDTFEETDEAVKGYTSDEDFDAEGLVELVKERPELITSIDTRRIKPENWNKLWESNFPMAEMAERVVVYAPFHNDVPEREYRICIMPQMAFGTGHHDTTSLMIEMMLDLDIAGKNVLDMGCGTGILAIFAAKKNAASVTAIDIDEWAYRNVIENCERNNINNVETLQGDSTLLVDRNFDIVLANINRNILLADVATYAKCLSAGGILQISGFYESDFADIAAEVERNGLTLMKSLKRTKWMAAVFKK